VLSNLLELYLHDLSEIFPIEVGADGHFGYENLPLYWSYPDTHFAFLIRSGACFAGFALATRGSPATDDPQDLDVAEFFVLRRYRRAGVGGARLRHPATPCAVLPMAPGRDGSDLVPASAGPGGSRLGRKRTHARQ
jgi:hypothetical protein